MEQVTDTKVKFSLWFDDLIEKLRQDQQMLELGCANSEKTNLYNAIINNNMDELCKMTRESSSKHFIASIISEYLCELKKDSNCKYEKIAFDLNDSEILVWVSINDNDETTENILWLSEAKINAKYHPVGFNISTTIIEKSDNIKVPSHYKILN